MVTYKVAVSNYKLDKKIPPGHEFWQEFNGSFVNMEMSKGSILRAIYEGRPITTWHKDRWRKSDNYLVGQHIGLDFDSEDKDSQIETLVKDKFIAKYAAFIHTTISHKEEAPRARVVFVLDTPIFQPKNYVQAASALIWLYGKADRACFDCCRFFYGAQGCTSEYLDNVLPLETVKKLIGQYQETGRVEKKRADRSDYHVPPSQTEVADALAKIPAWGIDYDEWVKVLMGIHSEFGEGGFALAANWADGKPREVEQKWKSFKPEGNPAGAVSIASVFEIAKRFGWSRTVAP